MTVIATARAFAPAHITGFFMIFPGGSTGAGINLDRGAETEVQIIQGDGGTDQILVNGSDNRAPVSYRVKESYPSTPAGTRIHSVTRTEFPVGFGFGMSGAGSFSFSLALNEALSAGKTYTECMQSAAEAEIHCGTGLGTVMTQQYAGFLIGEAPYPSRSARRISCDEDTVVCCFLEAIETGKIIRDSSWKEKINAVGKECMEDINNTPTVSRFRELSRHFTLTTGLASEPVKKIMEAVDTASMAMLGQTLFALVKSSEADAIEKEFRKFTSHTQMVKLGDRAAMVLK